MNKGRSTRFFISGNWRTRCWAFRRQKHSTHSFIVPLWNSKMWQIRAVATIKFLGILELRWAFTFVGIASEELASPLFYCIIGAIQECQTFLLILLLLVGVAEFLDVWNILSNITTLFLTFKMLNVFITLKGVHLPAMVDLWFSCLWFFLWPISPVSNIIIGTIHTFPLVFAQLYIETWIIGKACFYLRLLVVWVFVSYSLFHNIKSFYPVIVCFGNFLHHFFGFFELSLFIHHFWSIKVLVFIFIQFFWTIILSADLYLLIYFFIRFSLNMPTRQSFFDDSFLIF